MSRRFVAGETLEEAILAIKDLNADGRLATLDFLGENTTREEDAAHATDEQIRSLDAIQAAGARSHISIKLTAIGLDISEALARENLRRLLERARMRGIFVRIDMESSDYVDRSLNAYEKMRADGFENVGVVIQSALRRSEADVRRLSALGANIRLVKGAYSEAEDIAFASKSDVDANYVSLMKQLLGAEARANGVYCAIATHDLAIIDATKTYAAEQGIPRDRFELQMLYGIAPSLQRALASEGYTFRVYVPYGSHWYPYFMRRLAERPANVLFVAKGLFRN